MEETTLWCVACVVFHFSCEIAFDVCGQKGMSQYMEVINLVEFRERMELQYLMMHQYWKGK